MDRVERERRYLQRSVAVGCVIPLSAGLFGMLYGPWITGDVVSVSAESHFRYLSGLLFGLGLAFASCIPGIEGKTGRMRLLTFVVFVGGLGRLLGLFLTGVPSLAMLGGLLMELVITPLLCLWQTRVAGFYAGTETEATAASAEPA